MSKGAKNHPHTNSSEFFQPIRRFIETYKVAIFWACTGLIALFAVVITMPIIGNQPFGFDEGWIAQAPRNIVETGQYASYGAAFDGENKVFDTFLSTGPSVSIPIAGAFEIFGIGVVQARWVMLSFYVGTIFLLAWYAFRETNTLYALLAPLSLLFLSSSGIPFRIDILGEVAAVFYALGSFIAFGKRKYLLAGVLAALAVLTKFIMILLVGAGFLYFGLRLVLRWKHKNHVIKDTFFWAIGVAIPLVIWEIVRLLQTGSLAAYKKSLKEFIIFFRDNGSGVGETGSAGLTIAHKFDMLLSNIALSRTLMAIGVCMVVLVLWQRRRQLRDIIVAHLYECLFVGLYLFWWLFISNGGYTRYTVPLAVIGLALLLRFALVAYTVAPKPSLSLRLPMVGLVGVMLLGFWFHFFPWHTQKYEFSLRDQQQVAARVVEANPGQLTHFGWWQNPEMLFMTGIHSKDYGRIPTGESYTLLLGPAMRDITPEFYQKAKENACDTVVFEEGGYVLCKKIKIEGPLW